MKHQVKKATFGHGQDANQALFRKMLYNFLTRGTLTTTHTKAKAVKSLLDKVVGKLDEKTESNKNFVMRYVQDKRLLKDMFEQVGPVAAKVRGGYVTITRMHVRTSDGAQMSKLEWTHDIKITAPVEEKKEKKAPKTSATKKAPAKAETEAKAEPVAKPAPKKAEDKMKTEENSK
jgi:large subunit ribosomal protein L17